MNYAEVSVNSPGAQRSTFTYAIPATLKVVTGQAVWVPFGSSKTQGIVVSLSDIPSVTTVKEIASVIGEEPVLSQQQLALADWISKYYRSPLFETLALMLPPAFARRIETYYSLNMSPETIPSLDIYSDINQVMAYFDTQNRVPQKKFELLLGKKQAKKVLDLLLRRGVIKKNQELAPPRIRPKTATFVRLAISPEMAIEKAAQISTKASKQAAILRYLAPKNAVPLSILSKAVSNANPGIRALVSKKWLHLYSVVVRRDPLAGIMMKEPSPVTPTLAQENASRRITDYLDVPNTATSPVFLLHGVTGSGKTEVYLRLLQETLNRGKRGICLVPEIALTPQTIERFHNRFPGRVAVLHSGLSPGELYDEWYEIKNGAFNVVIGPRSALFAPQPDLGLIIIDEEHEWTYKQIEKRPRYHARKVAIKLAKLTGATVVLGSATPDIESYHNAKQGRYQLIELPERVTPRGITPLPDLRIIDMREELKSGNNSIFSRTLIQEMDKSLREKEQIILFLNRRGMATLVQCRNCNFIPGCPRCSVALTYHSGRKLLCHRCHYNIVLPPLCPQCFRTRWKFLGVGTETIEDEVKRLFPQSNPVRWDRDTTTSSHAHAQILNSFRSRHADVLIGTQMIAKGLDLPEVTLAAIINADVGLNTPDFRASERTFQLICQVAGRAGRGNSPGRVIVQSYSPEHYAIRLASSYDYAAFYEHEITYRREFNYPPFSNFIRLTYSHTNIKKCQDEAERMVRVLKETRDRHGMADIEFIGPTPAGIMRLRGRYRWQIIIRGGRLDELLSNLPFPRGWIVDVDPLGMI